MADIARLFLDGARPINRSGPAARRRVPPGPRIPAESHPPTSTAPSPRDPQAADIAAAVMLALAATPYDSDTRNMLLQAARGLADEQATAVAVVSILKAAQKQAFVVDVVGIESAEELPAVRMPADASGSADLQIARALHRLRPAVGLWLIAAPPPESRPFPALASIVHDWLLACPTDNDGLVAGYRHLKCAWGRGALAGRSIRPSVYLLSEDYTHAAVVHHRLRRAAQEFMKTDLALAGAGPVRTHGGREEPIRVLNIACDGPEDVLWAAILDELCPMDAETGGEAPDPPSEVEAALEHVQDQALEVALQSAASATAVDQLAQVLDPAECAALGAALDEPPVVSGAAAAAEAPSVGGEIRLPPAPHAAPPPALTEDTPIPIESHDASRAVEAIATPARPPANPPAPIADPPAALTMPPTSHTPPAEHPTPALRALDWVSPSDRQAQWDAVERSIWDLAPRTTLLDARPPMSWANESCICVDGQGRINVWILYRDGASWFALRQWASEHRRILALTRRDLAVDHAADVAVHVVLPLEEGSPPAGRSVQGAAPDDGVRHNAVVSMLLKSDAPDVHLYRLRPLRWQDRQALVVVPIG